jgi:DNA-directed RNA polymerase beta' subunit
MIRPLRKLWGCSLEMNAHLPQSIEAATELREIAAVPLQIVSPRESTPIVSVVQDTLVGANRFTRSTTLFTLKETMNLLVHAKRWDGVLPPPVKTDPQPMWSGQQLLSTLLPPVSLQMQNNSFSDKDKGKDDSPNLVKILNGHMLQGILDKSVFSKQLLHIIYNDYGHEVTVDFLDSLQAMIASFLMNSGFSVGISDLIADSSTNAEIGVALNKLTKTIEDQILQLHTGLFENSSGRSNHEEFEGKVMSTLNKAVGEAGKIGLQSLADTNRMTNMIKAGSKGSDVNVSQMVATLGQQAIEGKRIANGFQYRTLPHFKRFDDSAQARGFIASSYIKGLQPDEFFFHAMAGREGLIDTAVKTADTGYLQRQIRVALEDLITQHDGSVRDATGNLVQVSYGEDGINATKLENQPLPLASLSDDDIRRQFEAEGVDAATQERYYDAIMADRTMLVEKVYQRKPQKTVKYAVHLDRMIHSIANQLHLKDNEGTVTAAEVLEAQGSLLLKTHANNLVWGALVRYHMAPLSLKKRGYTKTALEALVAQAVLTHWKSWVEPGQPIGVIAAQSIGEPATQMSSVYSTKISIASKTRNYTGSIGAYVDALIAAHPEKVVELSKDSVVLDLDNGDEVVGVSNDEKTSWLPIKQVSRHPANGGIVEVRTRTGRMTKATLTHSFLKRTPMGIAPVLGSELKVGDRIPVAKRIPQVSAPLANMRQGVSTFELDRMFGWICGMYLADGSINGARVRITKTNPAVETFVRAFCDLHGYTFSVYQYRGAFGPGKDNNIHSADLRDFLDAHFGHGSFEKRIPDFAFHAPTEFIAGLLSGYFDGDGNVNVERQQIRLSSRNEGLMRDTNRLLGYCGLFGYLGQETSVRIPDAIQYTLNIPPSLIGVFQANVGLQLPEKAAALAEIATYKARAIKSSTQSQLDKIPALGELIAETGKLLALPGQSRNYGRWSKKESIGRETLLSYLPVFHEAAAAVADPVVKAKVAGNLHLLESAANADVFWDEITELVYHEDPHEFVYDFTVPGNDSFMVDDNILVHNTLNTFHLSGVASKSAMTRGVPRLKELMKSTKNPKAIELTIPLRRDLRDKKEEARRVAQELEFTLLQDIVTTARIYYDPRDSATLIKEDAEWLAYLAAFETLGSATQQQTQQQQTQQPDPTAAAATAAPAAANTADTVAESNPNPWILRFELDRDRMFAKNITMDDIAFLIKKNEEVKVLYTDYNATRLVFRIRPAERCGEDPSRDDLNVLKAYQTNLMRTTALRGVYGLRTVNYQKISDTVEFKEGKYVPVEQYVLTTDGSNFVDVIAHPDVDPTRVLSSNVHDIYENLGIEAARATLRKEMTTLFEESGSSVNYRHVCVLLDKICHKGRMMSIDRYGINKNDIGPLAKMSFEQTEDIVMRAALFGERDPCLGISAKVMLGAPIKAGTSFSELMLDETVAIQLAASTPVQEQQSGREGPGALSEEEIHGALYGEDTPGPCSLAELRMNVALPAPLLQTVPETMEDVEVVLLD